MQPHVEILGQDAVGEPSRRRRGLTPGCWTPRWPSSPPTGCAAPAWERGGARRAGPIDRLTAVQQQAELVRAVALRQVRELLVTWSARWSSWPTIEERLVEAFRSPVSNAAAPTGCSTRLAEVRAETRAAVLHHARRGGPWLGRASLPSSCAGRPATHPRPTGRRRRGHLPADHVDHALAEGPSRWTPTRNCAPSPGLPGAAAAPTRPREAPELVAEPSFTWFSCATFGRRRAREHDGRLPGADGVPVGDLHRGGPAGEGAGCAVLLRHHARAWR